MSGIGNISKFAPLGGSAALLAQQGIGLPNTAAPAIMQIGAAKDPMALNSIHKGSPEEIAKAATQFEAMLLQQMFRSMWSTVPKNELFGSGKEDEYYRDLFNEALAESVAENHSIGIKDVIAKDIKKLDDNARKS